MLAHLNGHCINPLFMILRRQQPAYVL